MKITSNFGALALFVAFASTAFADPHPTVEALSSRPGAAYTLYLNFGGFNYTGNWSSGTPGSTAAYNGVSSSGSFNAAQSARIKEVWARTAEKYSYFNINVTTVDPAVAAGQAATDLARQNYYDTTAKLMHTVIGGAGGWTGGGGVSFVGTTQSAFSAGSGAHTNWVFADQASTNTRFQAEATAHEQAHGLKVWHQSDYSGSTLINEYSSNNGSVGNGSFAPTMGNSYSSQRGLWRNGISSRFGPSSPQNDFNVLMSNTGISLIDDGIGHTMANATALPLTGTVIDNMIAKGVISPVATAGSFNPIGGSNYTSDYFSFTLGGGTVNLTVNDGTQYITPGVADPGATLDSTLDIFTSGGALVASGVRSASTLQTSFTGFLGAGSYFAKIGSVGGYSTTFGGGSQYYTGGSYFLTGSGFTPVPEPASIVAISCGLAVLVRRRRRN